MKVLIRGINGYIGSALCEFLSQKEFEIAGIDNFEREKVARELGSLSLLRCTPEKHIEEFPFYEHLSTALTDFNPDVIIDTARLFDLFDIHSAPSDLIPVAKVLRDKPRPWFVLSDIHTYYSSGLPISSPTLSVSYQDCVSRVPYPIRAYSIHSSYETLVQTQINFFRNSWRLPVVDLRLGLVYGILKGTLHRVHVDKFQGNLINYYCAKGVRNGIVTVPYSSFVAIVSLTQVCETIGGLLERDKIPVSPLHVYDKVVSLKGLAYKLKHIFVEDFDFRLRLGKMGGQDLHFGWNLAVNLTPNPLREKCKKYTIEKELSNMISVCFENKKSISAIPHSLMM